jgi:acyl carrier protein phosphodiesterase
MNWLAHVFLSEPDVEFRLGNLLADLVKGRDRRGLSPAFLRGTRCHQAIDSFTDFHPAVHRSRARVSDEHSLYSGILVDIFYDHFLARGWERYSTENLPSFTSSFYQEIRGCPLVLPAEVQKTVERMVADDDLGAYREVAGVADALGRVSRRVLARLGTSFEPEPALGELLRNFGEMEADFVEFFPELQGQMARWSPG